MSKGDIKQLRQEVERLAEGQVGLQVEQGMVQAALEKRLGDIEELVFAAVKNLSLVMRRVGGDDDLAM